MSRETPVSKLMFAEMSKLSAKAATVNGNMKSYIQHLQDQIEDLVDDSSDTRRRVEQDNESLRYKLKISDSLLHEQRLVAKTRGEDLALERAARHNLEERQEQLEDELEDYGDRVNELEDKVDAHVNMYVDLNGNDMLQTDVDEALIELQELRRDYGSLSKSVVKAESASRNLQNLSDQRGEAMTELSDRVTSLNTLVNEERERAKSYQDEARHYYETSKVLEARLSGRSADPQAPKKESKWGTGSYRSLMDATTKPKFGMKTHKDGKDRPKVATKYGADLYCGQYDNFAGIRDQLTERKVELTSDEELAENLLEGAKTRVAGFIDLDAYGDTSSMDDALDMLESFCSERLTSSVAHSLIGFYLLCQQARKFDSATESEALAHLAMAGADAQVFEAYEAE